MNKFDALKQFQGWPREWQELCAEYWAECDYPLVLPSAGDATQDQPKAAPKVAVKVAARTRTEYTEQEIEYMDILIHSGVKPSRFIQAFVKRFPNNGHPNESLRSRYYKRRTFLRKRGEIK
jgi:hypothetical protein